MYNLIKNYIDKMTKEDINNFALTNNITLSKEELDFLYRFIKNNFDVIYSNPNVDLSKYKKYFSEENFTKILKLVSDYKIKYASFLN